MQKIITNSNQLVDCFKNSSKLKEKLKVGIEFEKLGVFADSARAISYEGKEGISAILSGIAETFKWRALRVNNKIIGLSLEDKSITLEPGEQIELSTSPLPDIHDLKKEVTEYLGQLKKVSSHFKMRWLGMEIQSLSRANEIQWVPKKRYRIMAPYMKKRSKLAHHMMKKTASIRANLDFLDEDDFSQKIRAVLKLIPFTTAIFANSSVAGGKLTGFLSKRAYIWHHTNPARCGLIGKRFSLFFLFLLC